MDAPLFPPDSAPTPEPTPTPTPTPEPAAAAPTPDPEVVALREQVQSLTSTLERAISTPAPTPPVPEPEPVDPNDYLTKLANDPEGTINEAVSKGATQILNQGYGNVATQLIETNHKQLMSDHRQAIDGEFGKDTWKEVYEPALEGDLAAIRKTNPIALSNEESMQILVDRIGGQQRATLNEREAKHRTAQQEEWVSTRKEIADSLPPSGLMRRANSDDTPGDDEKLFLSEVGAKTGEVMDPKRFVRMIKSGNTLKEWQAANKEAS